jgi:hypothetical protein
MAGRFSAVLRRALPIAPVLCLLLAACGGSDYANKPRPASPINITAAISPKKVSISPKTFGAGPIVIIISNQTGQTQTVTVETKELGGNRPGTKQTSTPIDPNDTASMKVDVRKGTYEISAKGGMQPATVEVGDERRSAQDQLLEP